MDNRSDQNNKPPQGVLARILQSQLVVKAARNPVIGSIVRQLSYSIVKQARSSEVGYQTLPMYIISDKGASADLQSTLEGIVRDAVKTWGYLGALVATYEQGDMLLIRSYYIDTQVVPQKEIEEWRNRISRAIGQSDHPADVSYLLGASIPLNDEKSKDNLGVKAARIKRLLPSSELFDVFTPLVPAAAKGLVEQIQRHFQIKQVIAIPLFIATLRDGVYEKEYVGNLVVASRKLIEEADLRTLETFSRHIASAILSERRQMQLELTQILTFEMQRHMNSQTEILQRIVKGIVSELGYAGALVAPYEAGDALPVHGMYVDPRIATMEQIKQWEDQISNMGLTGRRMSLTDPEVARVYIHQEKYKNNLSVKAAMSRTPVTSDYLFDLFTPIVPDVARDVVHGIQKALGIQQVIAVPFFLDDQYFGNLFAATRSKKFSGWEIDVLRTFGQQAAAGLMNARLYNQSENRRIAAELMGRMAFSAAASVHLFRNQVGLIRGNLQLLNDLEGLSSDENRRKEIIKKIVPPILQRMDVITNTINQLQTPWALPSNTQVDVNTCINYALTRVLPTRENWVHLNLGEELPNVFTSQEMLSEAIRVVMKNALEALAEKGGERSLEIESRKVSEARVEISVRDNGIGIKPENLAKVFEIKWTTKPKNLGFGLFWAKDYIEGMGGSIVVESEWQKGTRCVISLPVPTQPERGSN